MIPTAKFRFVNIFYFLLLYFSVSSVFDGIFQVKILGLSLFTSVIPWLLLIFLFIVNFSRLNKRWVYFIVVIFIMHMIITVLRGIRFDESFIKFVGASRYLYFNSILIIMLSACWPYLDRSVIKKLLVISLVVHALNALLYLTNLPYLEYNNEDLDDFVPFSRFHGFLGGANIEAGFVAINLLILVLNQPHMRLMEFVLYLFLSLLAISPTLSRGGLAVVVLTTIAYTSNNLFRIKNIFNGKNWITLILIFTIIRFSPIYPLVEIGYKAFLVRFESQEHDVSNGRTERIEFFLNQMNLSPVHWIIGLSDTLMYHDKELNISDNTLTLLPVSFGIFLSIVFLCYTIILHRYPKSGISSQMKWYLFITFFTFVTNNAIIWTQWYYYFEIGYFVLIRNRDMYQLTNQSISE